MFFGVTDYAVFITMLMVSAGIGVYFGFISKSKNTTDEYLMGGRKMKVIPIAISLVASQMSAMSVTSVPAEVYTFGINNLFLGLAIVPSSFIMCSVFLPVFYANNLTNCYQYIEMRFGKRTRQLVTASFVLKIVLSLPVYMTLPSLSLNQATGINVHLINAVVSFICVFYTMLGGVKAVVWTDVLQGIIMMFSIIVIFVMSIYKIGGVAKVIENASAGERLSLNFSLDPRERTTVWSNFFSGLLTWSSYIALNQTCVQRIVSLPTLQKAKRSVYTTAVGCLVILLFTNSIGVIMFARYFGCDPIKLGKVAKSDKLVTYLVQDVMGKLAGMPGLFISCVFSATLSTMSALMNSLAGVVYFDYIRPYADHTDIKANRIMKLLIVVVGIYSVFGGFVVQNFKSILQIGYTVSSINMGSMFAIFIAGLFVPRINGKAAGPAFSISIIGIIWIIYQGRSRVAQGIMQHVPLPTSVQNCGNENSSAIVQSHLNSAMSLAVLNSTAVNTNGYYTKPDFSIYDISFTWYKVVGFLIFWLAAIPLSFIWKPQANAVQDPLLYSPLLRSRLKTSEDQAVQVHLMAGKAERNNVED